MNLSGVFKGKIVNHKTGEIICWEKHNKIVKGGFDWVADIMSNVTNRGNALSYIAFGDGTSTTTYNMTTLQNELGRYVVTSSWDDENRVLTLTGTLPQGSGIVANITEVGLFNAAQDGVMFDRATFLPKAVDNESSFTYSFEITLSE